MAIKNRYTVKIYNSLDAGFEGEWRQLWEASGYANVYNSPDWFITCKNTCDIDNYRIYACYRGGELVGVLPLACSKQFGVPALSALAKWASGTSSLLYKGSDRGAIKKLIDTILREDNLMISELDEKTAQTVKELFPGAMASIISVNPYLELSENATRFFRGQSHNRISNIVKQNRERIDHKTFSNQREISENIETMFDIEQISSKKKSSKDIFAEEICRRLYKNLAKYCLRFSQLDILYIDGVPVAYVYGLKCGETFSGLHTAYVNEYRELNPGKMLLFLMLDKMKTGEIKNFDLGSGYYLYKDQLADGIDIHYDVYLSKNRMINLWWKCVNWMRRLNQVIHPKKHSRDGEYLFKTI